MENEVGNLKLRNLSIHTVASMGDVEYLLHVSEMNRNSLVTSLLKDSLSGECITVMIATLSLDPMHFEVFFLLRRPYRRADLRKECPLSNGCLADLLCTMMKENPVLGELAEQAVEEMDSSMIKKLAKILKLDTESYATAEIPQSQNQMGFTGTALLNSTNDDFIDFLCTPEMKSSVSNYIKMNAMNYAQLDSECSLWRISKDTINHLDIMYNQLEEQLRSDGNALEGINEKLTDLVERINREEDYLFSAHSQLEELRLRREDNLVVMAEAKKYLWKCYFIRKKEKELYRTGNEYAGEKCVTEELGSEKEAKRGQEKVDGQKYSQKDFGILCKADKGLGVKNILTYNDREENEKQISEDKVTLQRDSMMTGDPSIDEEIVNFYRVYGVQ
ncbi:hypothetical protein AAG570_005596 [Ranatra chinensis]|uniref:Uncharacterized protein n=1 Tax=Ranatra chinensis TaxID=642074 RepID=A0ABD0XXZ7_9HEMI